MNKKYLYSAGGVIACLLLLHACSDDSQTASAQPVVVQSAPQVQQPQPVIVQSQPQQPVVVHDSDNGGFFSGMLMGHLMSGGNSYHSHSTVVHRYSSPRYSAPKRYYGSRGFTSRSTYRSTTRSFGRR